MKYTTLILAAAFAWTTALQAETPNIIFSDDFSEPEENGDPNHEIWGENPVENRGSEDNQWIRVTDEDSEAIFGEANNNYLRIFSDGLDDQSMWISAQNRFSDPSAVITVSFDFNQPASDDNGPSFRAGVGNPTFNDNRFPQDFRFEEGTLSGIADLYEVGETYNIQIVYNNSTEPVEYLDGNRRLFPNTYDAWLDGELVLAGHTRNTNEPENLDLGDPLSSLAFVVFSSAQNELLIDNLVVYDAPWVEDPQPFEANPLIFADDFSDPEPDGTPNHAIWGVDAVDNRGPEDNQWVRVTDENSEEFFGEAGNNYMEIFSDGADGSVFISAVNRFSRGDQVVSVHLDFYNSDSDSPGPTMRVGVNDPIASNNNRTHYQFRFENNALSGIDGPAEVIENNRTHNLQMVYNNSEFPITYADGQMTVEPDSYDVWIDGERVLAAHQYSFFDSANAPLGTALTSWGLGIFGSAQNELRIDNLKVYAGAYVEPAVVDGITFDDWAAAEEIPEGQRGALDDPAEDGVANIVKFALGLPALTSSVDMLPEFEVVVVEEDEHPGLRFVRAVDRAGIELKLEGSTDLISWSDLEADIEVIEETGDGRQLVRMTAPQLLSDFERGFLRLVVEVDE